MFLQHSQWHKCKNGICGGLDCGGGHHKKRGMQESRIHKEVVPNDTSWNSAG